MNVVITRTAEKFIRRIIRFDGQGEGAGLRLVVSPGGCSGLSAEFSAEAAPTTGDVVHEVDGMRLFLPAASAELVDGATIDFVETPTKSGFEFLNVKSGCACSSSATPGATPNTVNISSISRV